jgi:hypothetical protein
MNSKEIDWIAVRRELSLGATMEAVGRKYGIKPSRISMRSHREGWGIKKLRQVMMGKDEGEIEAEIERVKASMKAMRKPLIREKDLEIEGVAKSVQAEVQELGRTMISGSLRVRLGFTRLLERALGYLESKSGAELAASAKALTALGQLAERVYRWDKEPPLPDPRMVPAVNISLIRTSPARLREMAKAKSGVAQAEAGWVGGQSREASG